MDAFTVHTGTAAPLRRTDVDTDQIIPVRFLTRTTVSGYGRNLFNDWRDDPGFVLNDPRAAERARRHLTDPATRRRHHGLRAAPPTTPRTRSTITD